LTELSITYPKESCQPFSWKEVHAVDWAYYENAKGLKKQHLSLSMRMVQTYPLDM